MAVLPLVIVSAYVTFFINRNHTLADLRIEGEEIVENRLFRLGDMVGPRAVGIRFVDNLELGLVRFSSWYCIFLFPVQLRT